MLLALAAAAVALGAAGPGCGGGGGAQPRGTATAETQPETRPMQDPMKILLDSDQPEPRRIEAAAAIGRAHDLGAIDRMLGVADRSETLLVRAIVDALKAMDAHQVLAKRLQDPSPAVRADAARKLSKLQDDRALPPLVAAARDPEATVRRAAVHALSYLKQGNVDALAAALRDPDPETRAYAAAGLGRSADPKAARLLLAAREAETDDTVKDFIEAALRKAGSQPAGAK